MESLAEYPLVLINFLSCLSFVLLLMRASIMWQFVGSPVEIYWIFSLAQDLRATRGGSLGIQVNGKLTYTDVDEPEILRSEIIPVHISAKYKKTELLVGDVVEPFVEVGTALRVDERHNVVK